MGEEPPSSSAGGADVEAGRGEPLFEHGALLGTHLVARSLRNLDVEEVGGDDQRLVVAVEVQLPGVVVLRRGVETAPEVAEPLGQPLPLVVELAQSLSP